MITCLSASLRRRFRGSSTKATECGPFTHGDSGCSTPPIQRPFGRWAGPVRPKRREPDKHERSGLRDVPAEGLQGDDLWLRATALAGVETVDGSELVGGELEV